MKSRTTELKHVLNFLKFVDRGHPYIVRAHRLRRDIVRSDARLRDNYLQRTARPKLHIGGGWHRLEGWLNTDLEVIPDVMRMDATKRFPFANGAFQYIFSEHMIEHVPYQSGVSMLAECYRVLFDGGIIRVTTPDLAAILALHDDDLSQDEERYLSWFCQAFVPPGCPRNSALAINAMFRLWGHQFIYDEETLADSMRAAGFRSITRWALGASDQVELQNLENQQRYPDGLLNLESVALEGTK